MYLCSVGKSECSLYDVAVFHTASCDGKLSMSGTLSSSLLLPRPVLAAHLLYSTQPLTITHVHVQYRSRGTYTRVSSTSGCAREFVGVKLDNVTRGLEHSSPRTRAPLEDETTRTRAPLEDRAIRTRRPNYSHSKTTQGAWPIGAAVVSASVHGNPVSL